MAGNIFAAVIIDRIAYDLVVAASCMRLAAADVDLCREGRIQSGNQRAGTYERCSVIELAGALCFDDHRVIDHPSPISGKKAAADIFFLRRFLRYGLLDTACRILIRTGRILQVFQRFDTDSGGVFHTFRSFGVFQDLSCDESLNLFGCEVFNNRRRFILSE